MPIGSLTQRGFGYVGLMIAVVIFGLGATGAARILASTDLGEREAELLFVGGQFRDAIRSYYEAGPVAGKFPQTLADLALDGRSPTTRRHLRRIYVDPITGHSEWGLVRAPDGGIMGVYSLSGRVPMKRDNFDVEDAELRQVVPPAQQASNAVTLVAIESTLQTTPVKPNAYTYQDWKFIFRPPTNGGAVVQPMAPFGKQH